MSKDPFCSFASKCIFLSSDEDAQKGCAGLNVFAMQCRIEDNKFQGEVKEKKEEDASLKESKEIEEENSVHKENIELKTRLDSCKKIITELKEIMIDTKNENTELREELASCKKKLGRRHTLADVLKPEPPTDGTPRKSNPARHRRHRTVPPIFLFERKVETEDQAAQVSPSECNCPLPSITSSRSTAYQIRCLPGSMVVNVSLPTHPHAILTVAPFPPIQSSGTASVSTENKASLPKQDKCQLENHKHQFRIDCPVFDNSNPIHSERLETNRKRPSRDKRLIYPFLACYCCRC